MRFLVSAQTGVNAEETASRHVVRYLSEYYPYIIKNTKNFYMKQKGSQYV